MVLGALQNKLNGLYSLPFQHSVYDFLVRDPATAAEFSSDSESTDETLLILEDGDQAEVALYLDDDLIKRLGQDDPTVALSSEKHSGFLGSARGREPFCILLLECSP